MELVTDPAVEKIFDNYPVRLSDRLKELRQLIIATANETEGLDKLIETKKWGEPSYLTKSGSTIRLGPVRNHPNLFAMYFICTTGLITTFRMIYGDQLKFEGNRAILFDLKEPVPKNPIQHCITLALTYHKVKHLPMLGA